MNLTALTEYINTIIEDATYNQITALINEAILKIASGDRLPGKFELSPPLPDLYTVGTVDTALLSRITALPDDFNRDLIMVINSDSENIFIEKSVRKFLQEHPEQLEGRVYRCAVQGNRLLYRDIPASAETLTVHYYKKPDSLIASTDEPVCIPTYLHRKLIVGYVCKEYFDTVEDGIEGSKTQTNHYEQMYQTGLMELQTVIGEDGEPGYYDMYANYCE